VSIFGADEVKHLGDAFNTMAGKLQEAHDTLESRIQERTVELKESNLLLIEQIQIRERVEQDLRENIALQRAILQSANATIISTDTHGTILSFNATAEKKLGYSAREMIGKTSLVIIHDMEEVIERAHALSKELGRTIEPGFEVFVAKARNGKADENEWTYIRKDGTRFPVALSVTALFDDRGTLTGFMGIGQDLSEIKATQERLRMAEKVFVNAGEAIIITDIDAKIIDVNPAYSAITGYRREEILGLNPKVLKSGRHPPEFYQKMWQTIRETGTWEGEIWDRRKNGEIYPKWLSISSIRDKDGRATHYVGIFMDISRQKSTEEQLERLAYYDPLTNLANRALFRERLTHEMAMAARHERSLAVFFIDLDRFKYVNDTMGHAAGDELLQIVAKKLHTRVRASDTVARMGGDEFTIILTGAVRPEAISHIAQEMLDDIRTPLEIQGVEVRIGGSIGIAVYPQDGTDYTTLTKHADMAMYLAKEKGRNNYQFFSQELQTRIFDRITLEDELHKAVTNQEFLLHYQPQYDLASNRVVGVEALVRWRQQGKGMVSPATFIPLAEETGLILPMGEWILETALRQTTLWHGQGADNLRIAVNLSPKQFQQPTLLPLVAKLLEETSLPPTALELEITESTLMGNLEESIAIMKRLRELGIALALDDFGTGYSSLGYLKRFPVNTLKIDQSFVRELTCDSKDTVIIQAIIGLAHTMDLTVVAEGVETPFQLEFLREQGCDQVQGYLLSKPLPSQDVTKVL
ncbi:MAG: EAL domain-containing protein, partial [Magnetococcales bacterium]|nr:EAL domain-containing protein [Magnetococcales bacterium]